MSVEAMAWAFKQDIDDAQTKLILLALCDHADEDGWCWPSQDKLAKKACCSHDTAARRLVMLENDGFIIRRRRARQSTIYRVLFDKNAMKTHMVRNHDLAPTEAEKAEIMMTQNGLMMTQTAPDDDATRASLTIKQNHQSEPSLFASSDAKPPKRKQRMREDWEPDEKGVQFALERGFVEDKIRQLVVACRDYHLKHGTLIAGSIGLAATWRTWINNQVKFDAERKARYGNNGGSAQTRDETILAGIRNTAAAISRERNRGWTDEEIFERGDSRADGRRAPPSRIEDHRH